MISPGLEPHLQQALGQLSGPFWDAPSAFFTFRWVGIAAEGQSAAQSQNASCRLAGQQHNHLLCIPTCVLLCIVTSYIGLLYQLTCN